MAIIFQGEKTDKEYKRIISVVPSQTELLYDLGLDDEVIGITKFCVHPDKWFSHKNRVGGTKKLDVEKIRSLQPDIVLANKEENLKNEIEAIAAFTDVYVSDIVNLEDALEMIADIGSLIGKKKQAIEMSQEIRSDFNSLHLQKKKRAAYFIWKDPYMSTGSDTFIHHMMQFAGFENVFGTERRYPEITTEQIKASDPDVVLLSSEPYPFKQKHIEEFKTLLPDKEIILVDGEMFSWYGSRLLKAPAYFRSL